MEHSVIATALLDGGTLFVGALHLIIAGTVTCHVLMTKRDVPAAIGWIGLAWLSPVLGALLYMGFGVNRVRRRARRLMGSAESIEDPVTGDIASNDPLERLKVAVGKITGQDMTSGKVVATLDCGDQAYPQMLAAIESAKFHIRLSTYIFRTDDVGLQFIDALARAHRRGVRARVLIDGFGGGFLLSSAYRRLRRQGVPVSRFLHSTLPWKMPFLNLRLHKKSLIVDGDVAFVGGLNIGGENVIGRRPKAPVRDIHFRLQGPIVQQIEREFDDDWSFATGEGPFGKGAPLREPPCGGPCAYDRRRAGPGGRSAGSRPFVRGNLRPALDQDRHTIFLAGRATHYGAPIGRSAWRGGASRLAGREQSSLVAWAARTHIRPLLQAGCQGLAKSAAVRSFEIDDD